VTFEIGAGRYRFSLKDARLAVAGYAFGTREIAPPSTPKILRGAFEPELVPRWGYRTFDCIPASEGEAFSDSDILVAAGLNGRLDVDSVAALRVATTRATGFVAAAARAAKNFGDLHYDELGDRPPEGTAGKLMMLAWRQMMATPNVGIALTHKVLHHKQPTLFPLLDNLTAAKLSGRPADRSLWQQVHAEIGRSRGEFEDLRSWFAETAALRDATALSLPRLHDILLWLNAKGPAEWRAALEAGRKVP
jgi:hypothetical protein